MTIAAIIEDLRHDAWEGGKKEGKAEAKTEQKATPSEAGG